MYQFFLTGIVQGVGFRPYIFNACAKAGLKGYVQNVGDGVIAVVDDKKKFLDILKNIPPLARVDSVTFKKTTHSFKNFVIKESSGKGFSEIPADLFLCGDCLAELCNPKNRRCGYFFITCVHCGPRFSMLKKSPYDRKNTTMDAFLLCEECKKEYRDPKNRRHHAQTVACQNCGPKLSFISNNKILKLNDEQCVKKTAELLKQNEIIAIKGIGGFHLACRISKDAIQNLRKITGRKDKPYAVLCKDIAMAKKIAKMNTVEKHILESVERPIVVLSKKKSSLSVSELDSIGVMLPYTGLHYLLFDFINEPLIMTSSNISDEPITTENKAQMVSNILSHNRTIENPVDDSVMKIIKNTPLFLRRSRGFVPESIQMNKKIPQNILAVGAEMNNTFCIYKDGRAILSQYMGTTSNTTTFENYKKMLQKFLKFTHTKPDIILSDLHPQYNTSILAEELAKKWRIPHYKIQHHKAHAYGAAEEQGLTDFTAIVCDGLGYGEDATLWGGEIFVNNKRMGHLELQYQVGGDSAVIHPHKMLFSILSRFLTREQIQKYIPTFSKKTLEILQKQLQNQFNSPLTSSCGRILDASAALLGFCDERTYEGRPAMLLEAYSTIPYEIKPAIQNNILLTTPLFQFLVENYGKNKKKLAATVQHYLAKGLYEIASQFKKPIVFTGGCALNRIMASYMLGKGVKINTKTPPGDGGISFGQIAYYVNTKRG